MKEMHGPNPADTEAPQDRTLEPLLKFFKTDEMGGGAHIPCQSHTLLLEYY